MEKDIYWTEYDSTPIGGETPIHAVLVVSALIQKSMATSTVIVMDVPKFANTSNVKIPIRLVAKKAHIQQVSNMVVVGLFAILVASISTVINIGMIW